MRNMRVRYMVLSAVAGVFTPVGMDTLLQSCAGRRSLLFPSDNMVTLDFLDLYMLTLVTFIPFGALMLLMCAVTFLSDKRKVAYIFWGGFLPVLGFTLFTHFAVWFPLYDPYLRSRSTAPVAFVFMPFYCMILLPIGMVVGFILSYWKGCGILNDILNEILKDDPD